MDNLHHGRPCAPINEPPRIISRAEARALGLTYFYTGRPCRRGHLAPRLVTVPNCAQCRAAWLKTPAGHAKQLAAQRRYSKSEKGRAARHRRREKLRQRRAAGAQSCATETEGARS
jgi:hypothetical protein